MASRQVTRKNGYQMGGIMSTTTESACAAYLAAWARKDLDGIAERLHQDVHFKGPMQELQGRDEVLAASKRVFSLLERFEVRAQFLGDDRAMFAYDFVCREPIGVCPTAELVRFEDGLIRDIALFFDARPFEALQRERNRAAPAS
jgi:hypothetical protein